MFQVQDLCYGTISDAFLFSFLVLFNRPYYEDYSRLGPDPPVASEREPLCIAGQDLLWAGCQNTKGVIFRQIRLTDIVP